MKGLVLIIFLFSSLAFGQLVINPFIGTNFAYSSYRNIGPNTYDLNISVGARFNSRGSISVGLNSIKETSRPFHVLVISVSPMFRFLNSDHIFSPVLGIDLGTEIWSNAKAKFIAPDFSFQKYDPVYVALYGEGQARYKRGMFFSKLKLLADFQVKSFNISVGPTFNIMAFKIENVKKYYSDYIIISRETKERVGFGAELSVQYTFPMKKRAAKKALE